jgi:hypothetical protein
MYIILFYVKIIIIIHKHIISSHCRIFRVDLIIIHLNVHIKLICFYFLIILIIIINLFFRKLYFLRLK